MKTEHKVIALSVAFFVFVCLTDAFVGSFVFHDNTLWNALVFDVPREEAYHRLLITACFLVFGLIVARIFRKQRRSEEALTEHTVNLAEVNGRLTQEIAERKKLEGELRASEDRYRTVADFTYDWEFWVGPDGEFLWVAPSCKRVTGYSAEEFLANHGLFHDIIHPDDRDMVMRHTTASLRHEPDLTFSLDFRILHRDGEIRWINHVCQPVHGDDKRLLGRRASNRDITDRRQVEEALRKEEARFRHIYDNSPVMMHSIDKQGIVRNVNGKWLDEMGYSRDEVIGRNIKFAMTPESAQAALDVIVPQFWHSGKVQNIPYQYVKKDGSKIDVILDSVVMNDPAWGQVSLSTVRNVTVRKRAEEETRRTKALLDSIIQNLPTSVFLKDAEDLKYVLWNRASEKLYGHSSEEVIGKTAEHFFPKEQADRFHEQDREVLASGTLLRVAEQTVDTKHKGARILQSKKLSILDEDGSARYLLGISEDITDRKEAENSLITAREAAEQASRTKSDFLANMSHEIRTPINGIIGMTELALNTQLTTEQREYLETIEMSAESLLRLINDFLDFSKIEAGKLDLVAMDFSLRDFLGNTMSTLAVHAHRKALELIYHVPSTVPDALTGDPGRLRQVLVNVVGNAVKFTDRGEVVVRVETESEEENQIKLHFLVRDTGIGIPLEKQEKIFQTFEQVDTSTSRKYGGTGLGLAISSQLVQKMGGSIWVESEPNKGSTFHFVVGLGLQSQPRSIPSIKDTASLEGWPLLVVDDNATNRRILEETVLQWGMKPTVVDSGRAALAAMEVAHNVGRPFRLVLTDCMMPEMDGFQLAERIGRDPRLKAATIIMLTSAGERGDASRCVNLGIAAYLLKPIKQSELLFTLSQVLHGPQKSEGQSLITRHSIRESKLGLRILLAEDNPVNQKVAMKMLERMGHTVTISENGREVLDAVDRDVFDLILMDIQMPEVDGFEATRSIREREKIGGKHVPIVAMTAHAMKGDKEKCLQAGMDGYIAKPISAQQLFETIENLFQTRSAAKQPLEVPEAGGSPVDTTKILERIGGDTDLLKELAALFTADCPGMLQDIRDAVHEENAEALLKAAHALKGSVGNFAADAAVQAALRLETMGRNQDLAEASQALTELEREVDRVREVLSALAESREQ
jgi:two-component system, sensor histidine kinase and response regulator